MPGGPTVTEHGGWGDQSLFCTAPQLNAAQLAGCLACHRGLCLILAPMVEHGEQQMLSSHCLHQQCLAAEQDAGSMALLCCLCAACLTVQSTLKPVCEASCNVKHAQPTRWAAHASPCSAPSGAGSSGAQELGFTVRAQSCMWGCATLCLARPHVRAAGPAMTAEGLAWPAHGA